MYKSNSSLNIMNSLLIILIYSKIQKTSRLDSYNLGLIDICLLDILAI